MKHQFLFISLIISIVLVSSEIIDVRKLVEEINSDKEATWKADTYDQKFIDIDELSKSRLGAKLRKSKPEDLYKKNDEDENTEKLKNEYDDAKLGAFNFFLPTSYDARQKYSKCESIRSIRDQSNCGSCWAVSAASVFSDRVCIATDAKHNVTLSGNFVTACDFENYGCDGGYLDEVWSFFEDVGCITGGEYESDEGCQPYSIRPCSWPRKVPCARTESLTPKCKFYECTNDLYKSSRETDIYKIQESYEVNDGMFGLFNEMVIKNEIYENGPVQAGFYVYIDFFYYKSGVYEHKYNLFDLRTLIPVGGHAVKIIGWGEERGKKYWLVSNSWGEDWGEKGLFKIVRGKNNCFIESEVYAGIPAPPPKGATSAPTTTNSSQNATRTTTPASTTKKTQ